MDDGSGDPRERDEPDDSTSPHGAERVPERPANGGSDDRDAVRLILLLEVMALVGDEPAASAAGLAALILTYLASKLG